MRLLLDTVAVVCGVGNGNGNASGLEKALPSIEEKPSIKKDLIDVGVPVPVADTDTPPSAATQRTFSARALFSEAMPPEVPHVIPGLLPRGLSILAGDPKLGKSWLALSMALPLCARSR